MGVNLTTNAADKLYYLDNIRVDASNVDDVRFNAVMDVAYMSDTSGALLVMNMTTGEGVRVLVGDQPSLAWSPMAYNGTLVPGYSGDAPSPSVSIKWKSPPTENTSTTKHAPVVSTVSKQLMSMHLSPNLPWQLHLQTTQFHSL